MKKYLSSWEVFSHIRSLNIFIGGVVCLSAMVRLMFVSCVLVCFGFGGPATPNAVAALHSFFQKTCFLRYNLPAFY